MNTNGGKSGFYTLLPHQTAFVETFFSPATKRIVMLRSVVGLGKTMALAALSRRLLFEKSMARVLILVPSALRFHFAEMLGNIDIPSTIVDRYRFREMLDSAVAGDIWPYGAVSVLSMDFAKKPDITKSLAATNWDLLIAEEGHWIRGARADALRRIGSSAARIVLTLLPNSDPPDAFSADEATIVEWHREQLVDHDGKPLDVIPRPVWHEIPFSISPAELNLREIVRDLCRILKDIMGSKSLQAVLLLRSLESSPAALEGALQRFTLSLTTKNDIEQSMESMEEEEIAEGLTNQMDHSNAEKVTEIASQALQELNAIPEDSKLSALMRLLDQLDEDQRQPRRFCILTYFRGTLYYLAEEIKAHGMTSHKMHGGMPDEDRIQSLTDFSQNGGILIGTISAMAEGFSLAEVTDLILYDIPGNPGLLQQILGRFDRIGRRIQLQIHVLAPSNSSDSSIAAFRVLLRDLLSMQPSPQQSHEE
ncbi:hypothetical protein EH220_08155 [bacterium]|nr:MAG: hypothetical protein EH220_08155 [bacterium]